MTSNRNFLAFLAVTWGSTSAFAHVGDHDAESVAHILIEHGMLIALAAMALAAFFWVTYCNRSEKT